MNNSHSSTKYYSDVARRQVLASESEKTFLEKPVLSIALMVLCAFCDLAVFKSIMSHILYDSDLLIYVDCICFLVSLDVAPIILGACYKKKTQGYNVHKASIIIPLLAICLMLAATFCLSYSARNSILPNARQEIHFSSDTVSESGENPMAVVVAIFLPMASACTSLVSFAVSFYAYDPMKAELVRRKEQLLYVQKAISDGVAELTELKSDPHQLETALSEEGQLFISEYRLICEQAIMLADYSRQLLKEHLGDEAATTLLSQSVYERISKQLTNSDLEKCVNGRAEDLLRQLYIPEMTNVLYGNETTDKLIKIKEE